MTPNIAASFDAPRRILILLVFQLLFLSLWLHKDRILNTVPVSFQAFGLDRPSFHFRRLPSFGLNQRSISSWQKHGYVCYLTLVFLRTWKEILAHSLIILLIARTRLLTLFPPPTINQVKPKLLRSSTPQPIFSAYALLVEAIWIKLHYVYSKPLVFLSTEDVALERLNKLGNIFLITSSCWDCRSLNIQLVTSNGVNSSVLKPLRSSQSSSLPSNNLRFAICNARSVRNKVETIIHHAVANDIDPCIFTETWLKDLDSVCIADLSRHGYLFKSFPRQSN